MSIDSTLSALAAEGQVDSQGRFTLDPRLASRKLAQFNSLDPFQYSLHLVAAALSAGAKEIRAFKQQGRSKFVFDAPPSHFETLKLIWNAHLISPAPSRWVLEMSSAFHLLARLRPNYIRLSAPGGQLQWTWRYLTLEPSDSSRTRWSLEVQFSGLGRRLKDWLKVASQERILWEQRCLFCPIPFQVEGEPVTRPWQHRRIAGFLQHPIPHILPPLPERPGRSWGWGAVGSELQPSLDHNLEVVLNGVSFPQRVEGLSLQYLVFSHSLQTDLSQQKLVENELYQAMLEDLRAMNLPLL